MPKTNNKSKSENTEDAAQLPQLIDDSAPEPARTGEVGEVGEIPEILQTDDLENKKIPVKRKKRNIPAASRLAEKLRAIRVHFSLDQGQMAKIIHTEVEWKVHRSRVSQYESGTRIPSLVEVYNYAKYAGVTMETLINDGIDLTLE